MRKGATLGVVLSAIVVVVMAMVAANADGSTTVQWQGQGSENLPCDSSGGHWVLTPAHGQDWAITSATLTVNGQDYPMAENGGGSYAADSSGALDSNSTASASFDYTGTLPSNGPQLVLSHCLGASGEGGGGGGELGGGGAGSSGSGAAGAGAAGTGASVVARASTASAAKAVSGSPGFTG